MDNRPRTHSVRLRTPCQKPADLMAVGELARRLGISVRQAHRMNKAGLIPAPLRIGACVRWHPAEIDRWLQCGAPCRAEWERQRDTKLAPTVETS